MKLVAKPIMIKATANYCFQSIDAPDWFQSSSIVTRGKWLTWSEDLRIKLHEFAKETAEWPEPRKVRLLGGKEFDLTFTHGPRGISTLKDGKWLLSLADSVHSMCPDKRSLLLFRDILDDRFDGRSLAHLWALLRDVIASRSGHPLAALYAPLSHVGRSAKQFPLHADLYPPQYLWNVFDRVPKDGSGVALLLPLDKFFALASKVGVPVVAQAAIRNCLSDEMRGERFREFYDLLHVNTERWSQEWGAAAEKSATRLPLGTGEGYLIHDRSWLHGRETPTGGVTVRRVHRLVYSLGT